MWVGDNMKIQEIFETIRDGGFYYGKCTEFIRMDLYINVFANKDNIYIHSGVGVKDLSQREVDLYKRCVGEMFVELLPNAKVFLVEDSLYTVNGDRFNMMVCDGSVVAIIDCYGYEEAQTIAHYNKLMYWRLK